MYSFDLLCQYRELLLAWTIREIKVRYKQSVFGAAWAILQPLSLMVVFSVIFTQFVHVPTDHVPYPIFSYSALLPWTFLAASISFAVPCVTHNMNLVTKIYFPREILPISVVAAAFLDLLVGAAVYTTLLFYYRMPLSASVLFVPVLLGVQVLLVLGVAFLASAVNVFYRDVRFVVPLALQLWMYATPVIYPASLVPVRLRWIYMLNPMAGLVESYRAVLLFGRMPSASYLGMSVVVSIVVFVVGYWFFKRVEGRFADVI